MQNDTIYTIGQVAEITGISKQTVKKYVKLGYVLCARNPINNYRVFNQDAINLLLEIKAGQYEDNKK